MRRYVILAAFLTFIAISCSTVTFQPFTKIKYSPTEKVDLYTDEKPAREYVEIGRIIVGEDAFTGEKNMVKWALEKAQKVGANGLIWIKEDKQFYAIPSQGSVIAGDEKQIIFIAIRYKN
jgi:hypothetical protein